MTDPFALALKRLRTDAGISQSELSRRTFTVPSYIARLEQGARQPSREMVDRIITALNLENGDRLTLLTAAFLPADVVAASR